jgi:hypothetical protein
MLINKMNEKQDQYKQMDFTCPTSYCASQRGTNNGTDYYYVPYNEKKTILFKTGKPNKKHHK